MVNLGSSIHHLLPGRETRHLVGRREVIPQVRVELVGTHIIQDEKYITIPVHIGICTKVVTVYVEANPIIRIGKYFSQKP